MTAVNMNTSIFFFYRATLCVISAVFAVPWCLSAPLSDCHTAIDIVKFLTQPGSPVILILGFLTPAPVPKSKGNPFSGGVKYTGGKFFSTEIAIYLGNGTR